MSTTSGATSNVVPPRRRRARRAGPVLAVTVAACSALVAPADAADRPPAVWDDGVVTRQLALPEGFDEPRSISRTGRYVAYLSHGPDEGLAVQDTLTGQTRRVRAASLLITAAFGDDIEVLLAAEGRSVVTEEGDWHDGSTGALLGREIWRHDVLTGSAEQVPVPTDLPFDHCEVPELEAASADASSVLFSVSTLRFCELSGLPTPVYVRDLDADVTHLVAPDGTGLGMSADGRRVLVRARTSPTQSALFVRDVPGGALRPVVVGRSGRAPDGEVLPSASLSANGRFVAFTSSAGNLVRSDTNGVADVFVRDLRTGVTQRVSVTSDERQLDASSTGVAGISGDGRFVAFSSTAGGVAPGDPAGTLDLFVRDRGARTTHLVGSGGADRLTQDGRHILQGLQVLEAATSPAR